MRQLARRNREAAERILAALPQICHDEHKLQAQLDELAWLAHCPKDHRHQAPGKAAKWRQVIDDYWPAEPETAKAFDDFDEEIARMQRMLDELRRIKGEQKARAEDRRREQERQQKGRCQQEEERKQQERRQREAEEVRRLAEAEAARKREEARRREARQPVLVPAHRLSSEDRPELPRILSGAIGRFVEELPDVGFRDVLPSAALHGPRNAVSHVLVQS